jgi:hypothetical protein
MQAEENLFHALKIVRRQRSKSFELCAAIALSRLWLPQEKRDDARELLAEI